MAQKLKKNPRVILKSCTKPNHILHLCADGTSKDANLIDKLIQGSIKVEGEGISDIVMQNLAYFQNLLLADKQKRHNSHDPKETDIFAQILRLETQSTNRMKMESRLKNMVDAGNDYARTIQLQSALAETEMLNSNSPLPYALGPAMT